MKQNRFNAFADEDQVAAEVKHQQQQVKQQQVADPKKKVVVKVQKQEINPDDAHEFEKVENKMAPQRGGQRGGRGDRRGGRGGDRGRGGRGGQDRPQTRENDGNNRGGERRGRGRGDRPKTAQPIAAEGALEENKVQKAEHSGKQGSRGGRDRERRFDGKAREEAHPNDRQDGTGRGRRGDRKGGHGKGNWGKQDSTADAAQEVEQKDEQKEERRERKAKMEEKKEEPVEEEEEEGFTLDDYFAAKNAKSQGLLAKKEIRQHEKAEMKNLKDEGYSHSEMATTKIYKKGDTTAIRANTGAELMGFQAQVDQGDEFESRGKRGRGGRDQRPERQDGGARRRRGGKIVVDDNEFPAL